jgi:hypothetical protein
VPGVVVQTPSAGPRCCDVNGAGASFFQNRASSAWIEIRNPQGGPRPAKTRSRAGRVGGPDVYSRRRRRKWLRTIYLIIDCTLDHFICTPVQDYSTAPVYCVTDLHGSWPRRIRVAAISCEDRDMTVRVDSSPGAEVSSLSRDTVGKDAWPRFRERRRIHQRWELDPLASAMPPPAHARAGIARRGLAKPWPGGHVPSDRACSKQLPRPESTVP